MHLPSVLNVLGTLLLLLGGVLLVPLAIAVGCDDARLVLERHEILGFALAIGGALLAGAALRVRFKIDLAEIGNREGVAIVTGAWLLFSLFGCLPYIVCGAAGFTDAYFETMSGFTTTGASIFPDVEVLPRGLMFWRCLTQWIGGMGIMVLSVAVLPILGVGGYRLFKAEVPGGATFQRNAPRIKDTAKVLWLTYLSLSIAETLLLWAGGMTPYDAVCHTFTTMSTGGFSTRTASIAGWPSPFIQWVITVFMFLGGTNFGLYQQLLTGPRLETFKDLELRVYAAIVTAATAFVHAARFVVSRTTWQAAAAAPTVRAAAFQVLTVLTTTGFATEDFGRWPTVTQLLLLLLMFVGGCAGSTGGGMKVQRLIVYGKAAAHELRRSVQPRAVLVVRIGERPIEREVVANVMNFFVMYVAIAVTVTFLLALGGMDLLSAVSAAAANIGNVGPGLGTVGPSASYAEVPTFGKWVLVFAQLLGRLEIYSVLSLVLKRTWVR